MALRRGRFFLALLGLLASMTASLFAQTYESTPRVRSTDPATLRSLGIAAEIHKRFSLGLAALEHHDAAHAAAEFERILALHPKEPQGSTALYDLGLAQTQLGHLAQAQSQFKAAIGLDPGFLAAMANVIVIALQRNDLTSARVAADQFLARAPDSARALYSGGLVALRSGNLAVAQTDFSKLTQLNPASATAHYTLAVAQIQANSLAEAERELRLALERSPRYAAARLALGTVLLRMGRREEAREAFELAARDSNDAALKNLAASMRDSIPAAH